MSTTIEINKYRAARETKSFGEMPVWDLAGYTILFCACLFNLVALDASKDEIKLDIQVYVKLALIACCGFYGTIGFLSDHRVRAVAFSFPSMWVLVIFGLCMVASLGAFEPMQAMASSISILCIYLMTITAAIYLGRQTVATVIFYAAAMFVVGSWIVYFVKPEIGVMDEPVLGGDFVSRMGGLSHPNTLGQFAGICAILGIILSWKRKQLSRFWIALILISILALVMSYSRTAIMATVGSLLFVCRHWVFDRANFNWIFAFIVVGLLSLMILTLNSDTEFLKSKYLGALSKSGDVEEITTATGRGEIWAKSIQLIKAKPALGYGPTSSKYLLEEYSLYTHNLWLNVGLSCGVFGLFAAIVMCLSRFIQLFSQFSPVADGLFVFIVLNGAFENIIFSNLCGMPTICWVLALSWFQIGSLGIQGNE